VAGAVGLEPTARGFGDGMYQTLNLLESLLFSNMRFAFYPTVYPTLNYLLSLADF